VVLCSWMAIVASQLSKPLTENSAMTPNKFQALSPLKAEQIIFGESTNKSKSICAQSHDVRLRWSAELGSGVYASPSITDLRSDGAKEIVAGTFTRYVEAIEAVDGHSAPGWPFGFLRSSFHSSPLIHDVDGDGIQDIVVATNDAEIVFLYENGVPMHDRTLKIPHLPVRKDWYQGLDEDETTRRRLLNSTPQNSDSTDETGLGRRLLHAGHEHAAAAPVRTGEKKQARKETVSDYVKVGPDTAPQMRSATAKLKKSTEPVKQGAWGGSLSAAGVASLDLLRQNEHVESEEEASRDDPLHSPAHLAYVDMLKKEHKYYSDPDYVLVDPHIMATPVITDLDGDGNMDLIASVSYFFDPEEMNNPSTRSELPVDVDSTKYVAGGIVVFDLEQAAMHNVNRQRAAKHGSEFVWRHGDGPLKWSVHLDLTTETSKLRAFIYAAPTVVDLDGDGSLDVIVGTSVGFIYALDKFGETLPGFPLQLGEIQGQVTVEDITGDGKLDLIAADSNGNVVCFSRTGEEQWHTRISGFASQGATIADVDGDDRLDVLVATTTGHVWAMRGIDGEALKGFPVKTGGRIIAPVLPVRLGFFPFKHMQLVVPSFDGNLYIIDGNGACTTRIDLGESSYSMVLADDVTGDGKLDLVATTMAGNVFCFGTNVKAEPHKTWPSQSRGPNGLTSGEWRAIKVDGVSRINRDVIGSTFVIQFEIHDMATKLPALRDNYKEAGFRYQVVISLGGSKHHQLFSKNYTHTGKYTEVVHCPRHRIGATVVVQMTNQHGQVSEDSFVLSFNVHFYKMLKWLLVIPFTVMSVVLLWFGSLAPTALPV